MQSCDICSHSLGFMHKFKCKDGYLCKECYKKASHHYTQTITHKPLAEIKETMLEQNDTAKRDFVITGRIGNYVLFDEKHGQLCIANNRMTQQEVKEPEIYAIKDLKHCRIVSDPACSIQQLNQLAKTKEDTLLHQLKVVLDFKDHTKKEIILIKQTVRAKSYACRKTLTFALRIKQKIDALMEHGVVYENI